MILTVQSVLTWPPADASKAQAFKFINKDRIYI